MNKQQFKKKCIQLRRKHFTLGEIVSTLHRPKTTVYFHIKSIPKTNKLIKKIKNIWTDSIKGKGPVRGKSLLGYKYTKFSQWTPSLTNLVAHMLFDGAIITGGVNYYNRSSALIKNFKHKMASIYDGKPKFYISNNGVMRLVYNNVELGTFFKGKSEKLLEGIGQMPIDFQREFLKAFFDDEGSVDFRLNDKKRRIKGYQHNSKTLNLVKDLLSNFNICSYVDNRFNEILITRKENIKKFAKEINFSRGLKINGKRSNSVWRKSLEKRKILADLLASYQ